MNIFSDQFQYVWLMIACLAITLPLEWIFKARVYRRPWLMLRAILGTALVFSVWDAVAIHFDLWSYSPRFTTGFILPFNLPFEELLFFLVIPMCALLTFEAVKNVMTWLKKRDNKDA